MASTKINGCSPEKQRCKYWPLAFFSLSRSERASSMEGRRQSAYPANCSLLILATSRFIERLLTISVPPRCHISPVTLSVTVRASPLSTRAWGKLPCGLRSCSTKLYRLIRAATSSSLSSAGSWGNCTLFERKNSVSRPGRPVSPNDLPTGISSGIIFESSSPSMI